MLKKKKRKFSGIGKNEMNDKSVLIYKFLKNMKINYRKWLKSLALSVFYPFLPEELRIECEHIVAGGMIAAIGAIVMVFVCSYFLI